MTYGYYEQSGWNPQLSTQLHTCHSTTLVFWPRSGPASLRSVNYRDPAGNALVKFSTYNACTTLARGLIWRWGSAILSVHYIEPILKWGPRPCDLRRRYRSPPLWPIWRQPFRVWSPWQLQVLSRRQMKKWLVLWSRVTSTLLTSSRSHFRKRSLDQRLAWKGRFSTHWMIGVPWQRGMSRR